MGKTYRKVIKHPRSICENSPHSRNHNKKEKKQLHNSIKNKNRNKDELEIDFRNSTKSSHKNKIYHDGPAIFRKPMIATDNKIKNISTFRDVFCSIFLNHSLFLSYIHWKNMLIRPNNQYKLLNIIYKGYIPMTYSEKDDLRIMLKQMKRRGKIEQFKGNKKSKNYETLLLK